MLFFNTGVVIVPALADVPAAVAVGAKSAIAAKVAVALPFCALLVPVADAIGADSVRLGRVVVAVASAPVDTSEIVISSKLVSVVFPALFSATAKNPAARWALSVYSRSGAVGIDSLLEFHAHTDTVSPSTRSRSFIVLSAETDQVRLPDANCDDKVDPSHRTKDAVTEDALLVKTTIYADDPNGSVGESGGENRQSDSESA